MSIFAVKLLLVWLRVSTGPFPVCYLTGFSGVLLVVDAAQGIQAQTVLCNNLRHLQFRLQISSLHMKRTSQ
jgi:hypothetical protein